MKKSIFLILALALLLSATGCGHNAPGGEMLLRQKIDLDNISRIDLTNAHNGQTTAITEEALMSRITDFLKEIIGKSDGSGKGYYEGSYTLTLTYKDGTASSLGFGDSDCFYTETGSDGYPALYSLRQDRIGRYSPLPFAI